MTEEERYFEDQYQQEVEHYSRISEATEFLCRHGFMVIPPEEIKKYLGKYEVVPIPDAKKDGEGTDEIPF